MEPNPETGMRPDFHHRRDLDSDRGLWIFCLLPALAVFLFLLRLGWN